MMLSYRFRFGLFTAGLMTLAGCGGGGAGNDAQQIRQAVKSATTLSTVAACNDAFTAQGRQQFFSSTSPSSAKKDCQDNVGKSHTPVSALQFGAIAVTGSTATASVTVKGHTAKIGLVKQSTWKINAIAEASGSSSASSTQASTATTPASTTTTSSTAAAPPAATGTVTPSEQAELKAAATCLQSSASHIKGSQQFGKPAILARLHSGNVIALVLYGSSGGALAGERAIRAAKPQFDVYSSPNGKVLIFYAHKASKSDFAIGNSCQMQASAAG